MSWLGRAGLAAGAVVGGYLGLVTGAVPVDLGVGRRTRPLGPLTVSVRAPREVVFDVIHAPYGPRASRALREKVQVLESGGDLVLAAHRTPLYGGRLHAVTVETVGFTRPERVHFRLLRGPVPYVEEDFWLGEQGGGTLLEYRGTLGTDLWRPGQVWGDIVARRWEQVVEHSFTVIRAEAERRAGR